MHMQKECLSALCILIDHRPFQGKAICEAVSHTSNVAQVRKKTPQVRKKESFIDIGLVTERGRANWSLFLMLSLNPRLKAWFCLYKSYLCLISSRTCLELTTPLEKMTIEIEV